MSMYNTIVNLDPKEFKYELNDRGNLKFNLKKYPWSIKEDEFNFIRSVIEKNNLKRGVEISTGVGISSLAAGLGFSKTGGRLLTIDAYIEESLEDWAIYEGANKQLYHEAIGYKSVQFLRDVFHLEEHVFPEVGWSPDDTGKLIEKLFVKQKLDYAFIDGGHFTDQIIKDIDSVLPYLGEHFVLLLHDTYGFNDIINNYLMSVFGKLHTVVVPSPMGEDLAIIQK
jgi:hypothetical protein